MLNSSKVAFATLACAALLLTPLPSAAAESRPNILFIPVDDLRPELSCCGSEHIESPNIDRFAASGLRFDHANCQQAVCNPSRTSLVTGLRPNTDGVTGNHSYFRSEMPDVVTLPQYFRQHGYHAAAIGKLYHGVFPERASNTEWNTMRTLTHRLTQWVHGQSGEIRAAELHGYAEGLIEKENIANTSPQMVEELSVRLAVYTPKCQEMNSGVTNLGVADATGFEQAKAGLFGSLETPIGVWTPTAGRTIVDDKHAKTGKSCLHLTGGENTSVTLVLAKGADTTGQLSFWAERWTRREPFSFRIEKNSGDGWKEVFNGDKQISVGRAFLSHVTVPLGDSGIERLRFSVTSPPNTGVLIDDIRLAAARPQQIVNVEVVPFTLPALVGVRASPLLKLKIDTAGTLNPISLTELQTSLLCKEGDIESAQVYFGGANSQFTTATAFGKPINVLAASDSSVAVAGKQTLTEGENYVWIACKLSEDANTNHAVGASCQRAVFSNGESVDLEDTSNQRMGFALRKGGDDGVNTFRIPGLATTNKGTLIGVYDVRRRGGGDLPGDIDVGMSRSTDGGRTWESMKVIMDMGDDPDWRYDGIGDPAVLVDQGTGTIWVAATWSHGDRSWRGSGPGLKPAETGQLMLVRSDDDGVTWSEPINITKQVKNPEWCFILQGPGKGITMRDGTIVFAAQYQDPPEQQRLPHSTIIYSKDHGETWQVGSGAFDDTTEAQVVEVEPGVLMLNCRYNRKPTRVVMTTRDMGKTWQKHTTSERSLIEPGSCMASLIDVDQEVGKGAGNWLLFSNPDSTQGRHHITIKASSDHGLTWPKEHRLLLDEGNGAGYSCMSMIDEKTVGILYEGSQAHMTFQRISLSDITGQPAADTSARPTHQSLSLPRVFGNHMVLQADAPIPVWGQAKPGSMVSVQFGDDTLTATADGDGDWMIRFPPRAASATATSLSVQSGDDRLSFTDVLVGEVWVCAGQSNMQWMLSQSANGRDELSKADHPNLRLLDLADGARGSSGSYTQEHLARLTPETYCEGEWQVASTDSARNFSAVAWYFGRHLQQELKVPVGLICPAVGGTPAEAWIPRESLEADPNLNFLRDRPQVLKSQLMNPNALLVTSLIITSLFTNIAAADEGLQPWRDNAWYWSYHGKPVLLLGGSDDDNLFQWPKEKLLPQLDRLEEAGGNVIRNTMSDRKDSDFELYSFKQLDNGKYDLNQWNDEYWVRFERMLSETAKRNIVVQIEIWDRFDFYDQKGHQRWQIHPYNPRNNVNYTYEESGFAKQYPDHPGANKQPFFFTTPKQRNNQVVLKYQQQFVNKLLSHSLKFDHVLYCMDNETNGEEEWSRYWAQFVKHRAAKENKTVYVTEMWDDWNLAAERHKRTFDHPDLYDFVDVSQNNHNKGQKHWDNFLHVRKYLASQPRPMNTTKTYGATGNKFGHNDQDAIERFWRHLLAGAASVRFHRPDSGLGLNDKAVACIKAARELEALIPLWSIEPAAELLSQADANEAYVAADKGRAYAVYFPAGGQVMLDLADAKGQLTVHWININTGESGTQEKITGGGNVKLSSPGSDNWAAAIVSL